MAEKCSECHAPAGKPHGTKCSQAGGAGAARSSAPATSGSAPASGRPRTEIEKRQDRQAAAANALASLIQSKKDALALVGGRHFNPDRLVKLAHGVLTRTPALAECHPATVLVCLMRCAELNLEPDAALPQKRMWFVPRNNSKIPGGKECTYVIDYRAKIQLARETGLVKSIAAETVFEKDEFSYEVSSDGESVKKLVHRPDPFADDRGKVRGYYALARLEGGEVQAVVWGFKKMEKFRDQHAPRKSGGEFAKSPWTDGHFDEMALKTMLNQLWNLLPAGTSEQAQRLQTIVREEKDAEEGKRAAAVDLGIIPMDEAGPSDTTAEEVASALAGPDAEKLRKQEEEELEAKKAEQDPKPAREPGEDG